MTFTTSHSIVCDAASEEVYRLIRQTRYWPEILEPCLSVRVLREEPEFEHVEITALLNGKTATWQSKRTFLPDILGINTVLAQPMEPVESMRVRWRVITLQSNRCVLLLEHDYELREGHTGDMHAVIHKNSTTELGNFKHAAERAAAPA